MDNYVINGSQRISQYHFANSHLITSAAQHVIDRFYAVSNGANSTGAWVNGDSTHKKVYKITGAAGVTSTIYGTRLTSEDTKELAGSTVCLAADISNSLLTSASWELYYAGANNNDFGTVASPNRTLIDSGTFNVNGTMSRYSADIAIPSAATTGLEIVFKTGAQISGDVQYSHISLREGAGNSDFISLSKPLELVQCQHFYEKSFLEEIEPVQNCGATNDGEVQFAAYLTGANYCYAFIPFKVKKFRNAAADNRTVITTYNPKAANAEAYNLVKSLSCTDVTIANNWDSGFRIRVTNVATGGVNDILGIHWTAKSEIVI